jgi:hypothetical protein
MKQKKGVTQSSNAGLCLSRNTKEEGVKQESNGVDSMAFNVGVQTEQASQEVEQKNCRMRNKGKAQSKQLGTAERATGDSTPMAKSLVC